MTKINEIRFDSIEALVRDNERWGKDATDGNSSRQTGVDAWAGSKTYEEAVGYMQRGWPEGAAKVSKVRGSLNRAVETLIAAKTQDCMYGVEGDWFDVGRMAEGDPECCGYWDDDGESEKTKIIRIVANICVSAAVSTQAMYARGAACIAAVDLLESLGYRVELWAGIGCDRGGERLDSQVLIKASGQPVDTDRLAYVLCHPSFFRRVYFAHMELHRMDPCRCIPCGVSAKGAIVLPEACRGSDFSTREVIAQVTKICDLAGVTFDPKEVMAAVNA